MESDIDAAAIGKMFVTGVSFGWQQASSRWEGNKEIKTPGHWEIKATLSDKVNGYGKEHMSIQVEQGIGQKLAEILLPVIVADASRKAQQLADDSKEMLKALGERATLCITNMPSQ